MRLQYTTLGGGQPTTPTTPTLTSALKSFDDVQDARIEHAHQAKFVSKQSDTVGERQCVCVSRCTPLATMPHVECVFNFVSVQMPPKVMVNITQQTQNTMQTMMHNGALDHMNNNNGSEDDESNMFSDDSNSESNGGWMANAIESGSASQNSNDSQLGATSFDESSFDSNRNKAKKAKSRASTGRKPSNNEKVIALSCVSNA